MRLASATCLVLALTSAAAAPPGSDDTPPPVRRRSGRPCLGRPAPPSISPTTTSHWRIPATFTAAAIAGSSSPRSRARSVFRYDHDGWHVFGTPSRGPIAVAIDVGGKRVTASTPVSGRIQVEKRVVIDLIVKKIDEVASVGIDVSGSITVSTSPVVTPDWDLKPQLGLSADVNHAVAKTFLGDIDITGLVRDPIRNAVNGKQGDIEAGLKRLLEVKPRAAQLWGESTASAG